ncbi:beta-ketoacyl-[acyl-carrier-protein] synthase family protein [Rhodoferax sp. GW822-FHT02A01]|uniref:beta-ketoacyl-[acyl-carrier-protein] synthase family protein n=1 Tax=Rhodoferax sp. GW822-FHT02A01 TaxID=3141537 RepID=UPI00315D214E
MSSLCLTAFTMTSALGAGLDATRLALRSRRSGLRPGPWRDVALQTCIGEVDGLDQMALSANLAAYDSRNNRLAQLALAQDGFSDHVQRAITRYGQQRIGVFLGTSTSAILSSELAYRQRDPHSGALPEGTPYQTTHNMYSVADFVRRRLGLQGPACVVSTACSSSAKVFGMARRMMSAGLIDAALVGGVDSLCYTTLYGFHSLQLLSGQPSRPFDVERDGISIGEGAAFALLERESLAQAGDVLLTGVGESSDAHHMSAPHPQGLGAQLAMQKALTMAGLQADQIDYINLHGTSTPGNDSAEDKAVCALFGQQTVCSSTKGHTGHTLGAAGAIEAVVCALALQDGFAPGGVGTQVLDPALHCNYLLTNLDQPMQHVLSNSFGFGGSNCSLVFSLKSV